MSFEKIRNTLAGDTPGRGTELNYFRIGQPEAAKKVYLQAALHADEQPGILILHHLLELLHAADEAGELQALFVVFPMVNPLGMADIEFGQHQGRYNRASGVNHNRGWPVLYDAVGEGLAGRLGDDAASNIEIVRGALREWAEQLPLTTAFEQWRQIVCSEACDADYVFDLHCDDDSLLHIFTIPQLEDNMQLLANWTGAAATMLAEDSGGGSFDEVWPAIWLRLARECPDKPLPLPVVSCTLEFRGQFDTFEELNRRDAENLYGYFQAQGLIDGEARGSAGKARPPTDLRATEMLRAPRAGLLAYCVELGAEVNKGDRIADLLVLDGDDAFIERVPLLAGTTGQVISRASRKYVWRNAKVAKIVGTEILESRGDYLLSD
ncbi:MAG: succinylglutamate desuccinylase/aspartoacylase family protein [Gammaproteobacteria bacterium]|nr:MAG: succinylglutamate desuccinylase [Gammaproteobacteria bacterium]UCH40244.1 MAG: succinylglutamate desuccinylase/aspartoacylase family protein [Gammaproteobacteria bacterium]